MPLRPVHVTHDDDPQRQAPFADPLRQRLDVASALLRADRAQHADVPDTRRRAARRRWRRDLCRCVRCVGRGGETSIRMSGKYFASVSPAQCDGANILLAFRRKAPMSPAPGDDVDLVQAIEFREAASAGRAVGRSVAIDPRAVDEHDGRAWQVHVPHRIAIGNRGSFEHRCQVVAAVDQAVHVDEPDAKPGTERCQPVVFGVFATGAKSVRGLHGAVESRSRARHRA